MMLPALATAVIMAATPTCVPRVDDGRVVRATGTTSFVKKHKDGVRELVVRGVEPTAALRELEAESGCEITLEDFEQRFRTTPYELHARVGRHAIRVRSVDYEPETKTLRTRGRLEREPKHEHRSTPRQVPNATMLVYASTFVPFDSSF